MSLLEKKYINDDCLLGFWQIDEDYKKLRSLVTLNDEDNKKLQSFKNHKRKLEWLSVRALAVELTNDKNTRIVYNGQRKPFFSQNTYQLSISHSNRLTSVLISKNKKVGIDIEFMSHKIKNIAFKFINEKEYITNDPGLEKYHLYIHWCAKEAIYKICDKQDINFKQNLFIKPFYPDKKGEIAVTLDNKHGIEHFNVLYKQIGNYVIAWCTK